MLSTLQDAAIWNVPLTFLWVSFIIELTPGPNMTYLAVLTLVEGRKAGFATVTGIAAGLFLIGILAALGVAAFVSESRLLYELLRWLGALYM
ncbi:MAG: LysE family transporter, partial [Hyphomicrobium sp.]